MNNHSVVIVGGGLAAVRTAQELRRKNHTGPIQILSGEDEPPYDRPPLSKAYLRGDVPDEKLALWMPDRYTDERVALRLGHRTVALDTNAHVVTLDDGCAVHYDRLVIATGAVARPLPALSHLPAVGTLRTAADSRRLARAVHEALPIAVIGGGFIGLEVAATARRSGCAVTVIEALKAPLLSTIGVDSATWLQERHEAEGVVFRCGTTVNGGTTRADGAVELHLADGTSVTAAAVLVGVGVVRDCEWLASAGLDVDGGLICDELGRTNLPNVFGAGDIVRRRGYGAGGHWTSAADGARRTAHGLLELEAPAIADDGYFWSDQYDMRIQFAGATPENSTFNLVSGSLESGAFLAHFESDGDVTGLLAVNHARHFILAQHKMAAQHATAASTGQ